MGSMTLPATSELVCGDGRVLRYCLYGPEDGLPVMSHVGSPGSRWMRPDSIREIEQGKLRFLAFDRPGYGGSSRRPGRAVVDVVDDVESLADAQGWARFAVSGGSGGGPHALACAALLPDRVTRCAVVSGIRPADSGQPPREDAALRPTLVGVAAPILEAIGAGVPEMPGIPGPAARTDPDAMARIRATFVDSMDGWVDDSLAFASPWGFEPDKITVPVAIWYGTHDANLSPAHSDWLLAHIPEARGHQYVGGHAPGLEVSRQIHDWLGAST